MPKIADLPMWILLITTELVSRAHASGGLGNSVSRLVKALHSYGHEVLLIGPPVATKAPPTGCLEFRPFQDSPPTWIRLLDKVSLRRFNMSLNALVTARRIRTTINTILTDNEKPPDIVHYSNLGGIGLFPSPETTNIIRISSHTPSCRENGGYDNQSPFAMRQQIALENAALRKARGIYAPSATTAARVADDLDRQVEVLRTPFFLESVEEDPSVYRDRLGGRRFLLFVGLLNRLKGLEVLARAIPKILTDQPDLDFVFVGREHAGHGNQSMRDHVLESAGSVRSRILFLGELDHHRLFPVLRQAEGVVLPSLIDNLPNACLEAMALERVVVGTKGTSFEEILTDGVTGLLCRPDDPDSLIAAVRRLLRMTPGRRADMGRVARRSVETRFSPEVTIPPLIAFFRKVMDSSVPTSAHHGS